MIKIRCFNNKNINNNFFYALINNKNILKSKNGIVNFDPPEGVYKITVFNKTQVVLYHKKDLIVNFYFNCLNYQRLIYLTDYNYKGLKIGKGIIFFNGL